jgi:hypothetical protein
VWFAAWSVVSATFTGEVPEGLVDSFSDWDTVNSPLVQAPTLTTT